MFKRTISQDLLQWKNNRFRKPLIIRGARQVGKTSLIREFGHNHFSNLVEINLEKKDDYEIFNPSLGVSDFIQRVGLYFKQKVIPGKTLLFIDEIQTSQSVLELLRFFFEEKPDLHVIAAGSLLEATINRGWSIPVGRVDYRYVYPLTFFEYLGATDRGNLAEVLRQWPVGERNPAVETAIRPIFKEYMVVGGMPEAVNYFHKTKDVVGLRDIFSRLQTAYIEDIQKYSPYLEANKYLEKVVADGAKLAGSLFNYENFAGSSFKSREMSNAVSLVEKVMLLKQLPAINSTQQPIIPKLKRAKKMIWLDHGIANYVNDIYPLLIKEEYQGKIAEQMVGQTLIASGTNHRLNLYYWSKNRDEGSAEVDFCLSNQGKIAAFEVKSGSYFRMKSLMQMIKESPGIVPIRVSFDPPGKETWTLGGKDYVITSLPLYLLERWQDWVFHS